MRVGSLRLAGTLSQALTLACAWSLVRTVEDLTDPSVQWSGSSLIASGESVLRPGRASVAMRGGTKTQAVVMAALIPGGVLASVSLAEVAIVRRRTRLLGAAAVLMFAETLVIFTLAALTLANGLAYLWLAKSLQEAGV